MKIIADFDSGNIQVVSLTSAQDIQLSIRQDTNSNYFQWFNFKLEGQKGEEYLLRIINANEAAFPGWKEPTSEVSYQPFAYQTTASYDGKTWFRIPTEYDGKCLTMKIKADEDNIHFAFFPPYPYSKHLELIDQTAKLPYCQVSSLGKTQENRDIHLITIGQPSPNKKKCWFIARLHSGEPMAEWFMEGLISRFKNSQDESVKKILANAVLYLVPNMNPDGTFHGNLRTNTKGIDLNRAWLEPDLIDSPEIYYLEKKMLEVGVDFFMDVHGDEEIPYVFLENRLGCPTEDKYIENLENEFIKQFIGVNSHVQDQYHYEPRNQPGQADLRFSNYYITEKFNCVSLLLEMPFKDDANQPKPLGWTVQDSLDLGASVLTPLLAVLPKLKSHINDEKLEESKYSITVHKPKNITLNAQPPLMQNCFNILKSAGAEHMALFGGAVRDADYAATYQLIKPIKDYDLRIWLSPDNYEDSVMEFISRLENKLNKKIRLVPSAGTGRIRYCTDLEGVELDISIRPIPTHFYNKSIPVEAVALDRASDSDIGLSSVAIDSQGNAWAMPDYIKDRDNKTLTIYPNNSLERRAIYANRMKEKFTDHNLVWLPSHKVGLFKSNNESMTQPDNFSVSLSYSNN